MELHAFKHTAPDHGVGLLSQPRHIWKQSHLINKNNGYELRAVLQSVAQSEAALQQHFLHCLQKGSPACTTSSTPDDLGVSCRHWEAPCLGLSSAVPTGRGDHQCRGVFTLSGAGSLLCYLSCLFLCLPCSLSWALSVMHVRVLVH